MSAKPVAINVRPTPIEVLPHLAPVVAPAPPVVIPVLPPPLPSPVPIQVVPHNIHYPPPVVVNARPPRGNLYPVGAKAPLVVGPNSAVRKSRRKSSQSRKSSKSNRKNSRRYHR